MASLRHPNVVMFMGMCVEPPCIITEFCARGSLFDVLRKARISPAFAQQLDWSRRLSMALDAAKVRFPCLIFFVPNIINIISVVTAFFVRSVCVFLLQILFQVCQGAFPP